MVAWAAYKKMAQDRGSLALELYVVTTVPVKPPEEVKALLQDHLAYQNKLEAEGKLALAGPLSDPSGENMEGEGMIVYQAESLAMARDLAENDPMHQSRAREFTIRRWLLNEGTFRP